uniref:F-box domain-containing protein n=1 Tax=Aegilops tauschii subsp. strangulata TaxID=200361 RepID=A0A453LHH5_AEGTS
MGGGRRCRKNSRRGSPPAAEIDVLLDDLLELVFLRLPSPANLVRAASTCKRWRRVIAGDGGGLLRRYGTLHGASDDVVGHYCVDDCDGYPYRRRPSLDPVFVPSPSSSSPWADTVAARNLALDFLPRGEFGDSRWELADIRGGLLLVFDRAVAPRLLICDPLRRCYREIPRSAWFHGCHLLGAFLLDGEDADAGISMSNFRVSCMLYCFRNRNGSVKFRFWSRGQRLVPGPVPSRPPPASGPPPPDVAACQSARTWSWNPSILQGATTGPPTGRSETTFFFLWTRTPPSLPVFSWWTTRSTPRSGRSATPRGTRTRCRGHLRSKLACPSCIRRLRIGHGVVPGSELHSTMHIICVCL